MKYTHRFISSYDEYNNWQCFSCKNDFIYNGVPAFCPDCGYKLLREFTHKNPRYSPYGLKSSIRNYPAFGIEYLPKTIINNNFGDYFGGFFKKEQKWESYSGFKVDYLGSAKKIIEYFKNMVYRDDYKSVRIVLQYSKNEYKVIYQWDSKNPTITVKPMQGSGCQCSG